MSSENSSPELLEPGQTRRLEVVSEKILPDRRRRSSAQHWATATIEHEPPPPPTAPPPPSPHPRDRRLIAVFEAISYILAVRVFMMGAVIGSFALAWRVHDVWSAAVFAGFTAGVTVPMIWTDYKARAPKG